MTGQSKNRRDDVASTAEYMNAIRIHAVGGPEGMVYERAPRPRLHGDDALVRVHAAALTPAELTWKETWEDHSGKSRVPIIPSHELSGVIAELGTESTGLNEGEEVYGLTDFSRDGAAAEFVAVRAADLAPKPRSVDHLHAAAMPLSALTACAASSRPDSLHLLTHRLTAAKSRFHVPICSVD
jgi:NADPH:quinone reductase-like Zn-dependent oxidoreductase